MRIAVVVLVLLGVGAAVCAVVLMRTLTLSGGTRAGAAASAAEVEVYTVTRALPAMTVVDGKMIQAKKVKKSDLPEGTLENPVQFVGKVLMRPMVEGEALSESCFATDGVGHYLAAALPPGKRAVSVQFRDHAAMAGLLYPGSVVDVLVSVQSPSGAEKVAIATTLLQGAQVLAVGSQSVTSGQQFKDKNPGALNAKGQQTNTRMVTLLVTPKQAEILQLATQYGVVSLAMRNPLDTAAVPQELTRVSEFTTTNDQARSGTNLISAVAAALLKAKPAPATQPAAVAAAAGAGKTDPFVDRTNPLWEMLVVRGAESQTQKFPMPDEGRDAAAAAAAVAHETTGGGGKVNRLHGSPGTN